jgi:hypothetical protein
MLELSREQTSPDKKFMNWRNSFTYLIIGSFRGDLAVPNREQEKHEDEGHVSPHFVVPVTLNIEKINKCF